METLAVPPELRAKLGTDASNGLVDMFGLYNTFATERFDHALVETRFEMRLELERGLAGIRLDMERMRSDLIKWNLVFWIGQFAAMTAVLSYMLEGR